MAKLAFTMTFEVVVNGTLEAPSVSQGEHVLTESFELDVQRPGGAGRESVQFVLAAVKRKSISVREVTPPTR